MSNNQNNVLLKRYSVQDLNLQEFFENPCLEVISMGVHVHKQNSRQGTVACKSRSDLISRSNKKPWKQKGTGRARAGTPRSPLWRGGGVCHGPQPRTRVLSIPKKMNHLALKTIMAIKAGALAVYSLDWKVSVLKTKDAFNVFKSAGLLKNKESKFILLYDINDLEIFQTCVNISSIMMIPFNSVYVDAFHNKFPIVFLEKDKQLFTDMVNSWH